MEWKDRLPKAFFRGRDSSKERLKLVRRAKEYPEMIDAGITRYFFFRDEESRLGTKESISFFDFFKVTYKVLCVAGGAGEESYGP